MYGKCSLVYKKCQTISKLAILYWLTSPQAIYVQLNLSASSPEFDAIIIIIVILIDHCGFSYIFQMANEVEHHFRPLSVSLLCSVCSALRHFLFNVEC